AWVGIASCVVILGFGVTTRLLGPAPGVTEANVKRLRLGMTRAEVKAILGQLPAYHMTQVTRGGFRPSTFGPTQKAQFTPGGFDTLAFDPKARFGDQGFGGSRVSPPAAKEEPPSNDQPKKGEVGLGAVVITSGNAEALEEVLRTIASIVPGEAGSAFISFGEDGRLTRAEWSPNPGATVPKAGLGEYLRSWLP
ncbi:MAG TPA: hypothetical protein VEL76_24925, partial [Gemmataceae bacterium]|nr:hypothetical protein [Gemmataceae bacterium]